MTAILGEITANDPRLKMFASPGMWGTFVEAFGYDADGDGGTFTLNGYVKSDEDDLFPAIASTYATDIWRTATAGCSCTARGRPFRM